MLRRVHAADLADSVGTCAAIDRVNRYMGASHSPGSPGQAVFDKDEDYHGKRKQSIARQVIGGVRLTTSQKLPPHWAFMDDVTTLLRTAPCTNRVLKRQEDVTVHIRIHGKAFRQGATKKHHEKKCPYLCDRSQRVVIDGQTSEPVCSAAPNAFASAPSPYIGWAMVKLPAQTLSIDAHLPSIHGHHHNVHHLINTTTAQPLRQHTIAFHKDT
ncbi:hypothetical protein Bbelb_018700 [Branchiostoma belcheri]|nr:hypothetical protein Bbelb_018700 [Branchiostoma belcheri]